MTLRSRATPAVRRPATWIGTPEPVRLAPSPLEELDEAVRIAGLLGRGYLQQRYEALRCALTRPCVARHEEPGELVSTANMRGASRQAVMAKAAGTKSKRAMGERIARTFCVKGPPEFVRMELAFSVVVITRIAPRPLDSDNLESACKALRDGIATGLGFDDRSSLVRYVVSQQQGEPRQHLIRAELFIEPTQGEAP